MREPETQVLQLAFPEFVKCSSAWRARRLYMRVRGGAGGGCLQVLGLRAAAVRTVVELRLSLAFVLPLCAQCLHCSWHLSLCLAVPVLQTRAR